jgi:exodeoxyribonuclease VII large subunit
MAEARALSVSEITSLVKEILEGSFPAVTVEGEISNARPSSAGHVYFTLKDESSAISAVMFKGKARALGFTPKDGMLVRASGSVSVYEARGTYQIIVDRMELSGTGDILRLLEERKRRLAAEGLFDEARKRPIPEIPERVAVVTSPTGAAIRDVLTVLRRRNKGIDVIVLPSPVQGEGAGETLAKQIEAANRFSLGDVIILCRGGGSLEDLLPFSDEILVRAVAASSIPVISAVGHEIDWSLSDYAADARAPTPSAAAELVSPLKEDLASRVGTAFSQIVEAVASRVERIRLTVARFSAESLEMRFRRIEQPLLMRLDDAKEALLSNMYERIRDSRSRIREQMAILDGAKPSSILSRGYSVVRDAQTGAVIRSASDTASGRLIHIIPAAGRVSARVEEAKS